MTDKLNFSHFVVSWWEKLSGRDNWEDLGVDGMALLKRTLNKSVGKE
jgi:hypothetical protein